MLAAAGCQSGDKSANLGGNAAAEQPQAEAQVRESELRAYCPKVVLREGTSYYSTYAKGGEQDASKVIYQASITDVTRKCDYTTAGTVMTVAVAGKVIPGPLGAAGTISMPIRVAVVRGDQVVDSTLHKYSVNIADTSSSSQFIFNDPNVNIPAPVDASIQVFVGFDEGPDGGN